MKRLSTVVMLALWVGVPCLAHAQETQEARLTAQVEAPPSSSDLQQTYHVTNELIYTPMGRQALAEYRRLKTQGLLPQARKHTEAVGDTVTFRVLNQDDTSPNNLQLEDIDFVLMDVQDRFQIWVELAELENGHITEIQLANLTTALGDKTPVGSYNANMGIIDIDEAIFGTPPNVDGDNKIDVLWLNIRDGNRGLAGFFWPGDLTQSGNLRDIIYMNTVVDIQQALQTAAHEFQHLIQSRYDTEEITFVNEGLSEWAEVACGYIARPINYLGTVSRYNVPFFRFNRDNPLDDYERAGLFINYVADRFGPLEAGKITRNPASGSEGLRSSLVEMNAGVTLEELLFDFHTTNFFNNNEVDPIYEYTTEQRQNVRAATATRFDGRLAEETPATQALVWQGGIQYLVWEQVEDLNLNITTSSQDITAQAFLFDTDGSFDRMAPVDVAGGGTTFDGLYGRVAVVLSHTNPDGVSSTNINYSASWTVDQLYDLQSVVYDDGSVPFEQNSGGGITLQAYALCDTASPTCGSRQANRFDIPEGGILTSVSVAPYYDNDFSGSNQSATAPRNFMLTIWADNGAGNPSDNVLFSLDVADDRRNGNQGALFFKDINLSAYQDELANLPSTVYIGITDAGTDKNYLIMGVTEYSGDNVSFLYLPSFNSGQGAWAAFPNLTSGGEAILVDKVLPIRAAFLTPAMPTASEDAADVPSRIALYPNFPNPFNPTTSIRYALPHAADVHLAVYDVLGRQVAVLIDGLQTAGEHQVQVNAEHWASGMYFYTLQTAEQKLTRQMVLIK